MPLAGEVRPDPDPHQSSRTQTHCHHHQKEPQNQRLGHPRQMPTQPGTERRSKPRVRPLVGNRGRTSRAFQRDSPTFEPLRRPWFHVEHLSSSRLTYREQLAHCPRRQAPPRHHLRTRSDAAMNPTTSMNSVEVPKPTTGPVYRPQTLHLGTVNLRRPQKLNTRLTESQPCVHESHPPTPNQRRRPPEPAAKPTQAPLWES